MVDEEDPDGDDEGEEREAEDGTDEPADETAERPDAEAKDFEDEEIRENQSARSAGKWWWWLNQALEVASTRFGTPAKGAAQRHGPSGENAR